MIGWEFNMYSAAQDYRRKRNILVGVMTVVWASISFGLCILAAPYFNQFHFFGFPLGFWLTSQGSVFFFVIVLFAYSAAMNRLDRRHGVQE